ncbi:MAG: type II 3-dehydroquinate dehydratase [Deltaproteobacteria bacterium]|jgi:3-dehydroquinate dehydratase-2|nr:type II 3-dehydroquinate dehydratase [Deltaproteobacteria bacterium]
MKKILVLNGPNLNMLGKREPDLYGFLSLTDLNVSLRQKAEGMGLNVDFYQSNHEGDLVDRIQGLTGEYQGAVLNAGAYTHTSLAIRDAVLSVSVPVIEVHLTNPHAREHVRRHSFLSGAAIGAIEGFGARSYELALYWFATS